MISAETIEPLINSKTRAIYVLHKEGSPADINKIYALAREHNLKVIEDAAHAFGAKVGDMPIGQKGDFVCFSFQAIKHITTGDGGALLCGSDTDYQLAKQIKWFGIDRDKREGRDIWHEDIPSWGLKGNMNDIAGTLGVAQMDYIEIILDKFHKNGRWFDETLKDLPNVRTLSRSLDDYQTYWAYTILVENRAEVQLALADLGISSSQIHVRNDKYSMFGDSTSSLTNVDFFDTRELALPCGWWLTDETKSVIVDTIKRVAK